jgi:long-chain acyl-CoA synthetase
VLNWLPFSHIYARTVDVYGMIVSGVTMCLAESAESVVLNLAETQPTNMSGVPRFYEKVYALTQTGDPAQSLRRLRGVFGLRIDWLNSGGAPLPPAIPKAFQAAGLLLLQGYGLTESSPVITFNRKDRYKLDTVGLPIPGVEVRIAEDGEVLTRGPHVMKGYWRDPEATAAAIRDGWLHTGDLGQLDADGFLHITGRKKDLLVLSNGKKIVPNYIEGLLLADPCIEQVVVCGEGKNFLTALIVPNWPFLRKTVPLDSETEEALARDPRVEAFLTERVRKALADVSVPEQVRRFVIVPRPFSVAAEEMTVSLKLRRNVIVDHHRAELDALYQDSEALA